MNFQLGIFVNLTLEPQSVSAKSFGINTSPLLDSKAPHIEYVPIVIIE